MARAGFLLSPLVEDAYSFAALASSKWRKDLDIMNVTNILVSASSEAGRQLWYELNITISFFRLDFPQQYLSNIPVLNGYIKRRAGLCQLTYGVEHTEVSPEIITGAQGRVILYGQTPSAFLMRSGPGTTKLRIGFGLLDSAWKDGGQTDGVEFRVSAVRPDGSARIVWSHFLDPVRSHSDRGEQHAEIELGATDTTRLRLETLPGQNEAWDWAYWSEATVE